MFARSMPAQRPLSWHSSLAQRGLQICPSSVTVPVELRGLLPDGRGFHLLCRGVSVRLDLYAPERAAWEVPVAPVSARPEDAYADYAIAPLTRPGRLEGRPVGARLVFAEPDRPDERRVFDGQARLGWRGHDAGLLQPESAVVILLRLLARDDLARDDLARDDLGRDGEARDDLGRKGEAWAA